MRLLCAALLQCYIRQLQELREEELRGKGVPPEAGTPGYLGDAAPVAAAQMHALQRLFTASMELIISQMAGCAPAPRTKTRLQCLNDRIPHWFGRSGRLDGNCTPLKTPAAMPVSHQTRDCRCTYEA